MIKSVRYSNQINKEIKDTFYLENRNFDDFGYKTTYYLYYVNEHSEIILIGEVKILNIDKKHTKLDESFEKLDSDKYYSLGQSREYYLNLRKLGRDKYENLFDSLNDYSMNPNEDVLSLRGFKDSLLRESIAYKLIKGGKDLIEYSTRKENPQVINYTTKLAGDSNDTEIEINLKSEMVIPYRIFAIVGKNGVGKSRILENLMNDLINENWEKFNGEEIKYKKIIHFSYGDLHEKTIRRNEKINSIEFMNNLEDKKLEEIKAKEREDYLEKLLGTFFEKNRIKAILNKEEKIEVLSSGERMVINFILKLIHTIEESSLIVIDEIENHLHPNYLGMIISVLYQILRDYDCHGILSTHSPIVIQQIPSKNIKIMIRNEEDNYSFTKSPDFEVFGENLSEISDKIFNITSNEMFYQKFFEKNKLDNNSVFLENLSFNARMYYETQRAKNHEE